MKAVRQRLSVYIPIILAALSYVMINPNTVVGTPGDYVLLSMGISPWTGGFNPRYNLHIGRHVTPYIFGFALLVALAITAYQVIRKNRVGKTETVLAFVTAMVVLNFTMISVAQYSIGNSEGLGTIRHDASLSRLEYELLDGDLSSFNMNLAIKNFSEESHKVYVSFRNIYKNNLGSNEISIHDLNGNPVMFEIGPDSNEVLEINSEAFLLDGWKYIDDHYKAICIEELHLTNELAKL